MTVAELIQFLQTQPQDLLVASRMYSEQRLLEVGDIAVEELGIPRNDGWVPHKRGNVTATQKYLVFPGN